MQLFILIWMGVLTFLLVWVVHAVHCICSALESLVEISSSDKNFNDLLAKHITELQKDKGQLIDEETKLKILLSSMYKIYNSRIDPNSTTLTREEHEILQAVEEQLKRR